MADLGGVKTQSIDQGQASAECMTIGGGRGAFYSTHGDYPVAVLCGVKTQSFEGAVSAYEATRSSDGGRTHAERLSTNLLQGGGTISLQMIGKNV